MTTIADLVIRLSANTAAAEKDVTSFAGKLQGGLRKALVPAGAALGVVALGAKKVIDAASDMNETVSKTGVVFGPATKSVIRFGEGSARALGISKKEALDAASTYGTFGKAAGKTGKALSDFSIPLVKAASDLASFHNVPVAQALEDIRSGLAGETEPLRKYGILLNDAQLRQQALAMGLVKTTKDALSPQNKMLAAQQLILKGLGPAQGDFARTASSAANQARIQSAETANLSAQLGTSLLPAYQSLQRIGLQVTAWMAKHPGLIKVVALAVAVLAAAIIALNIVMAVAASVPLMIIVGLVALGAALVLAWQKSEKFRAVVLGTWEAIKTATQVAWPVIRSIITTTFAVLRTVFMTYFNAYKTIVMTAIAAIIAIVRTIIAIVGVVSSALSAVRGAMSTAWNAVKSVVVGAVDAIKNAVRTGFNALAGIIRAVAGAVRGAANTVKSALQPILDILQSIASAADSVRSALSKIGGAASAVKGVAGKVGGLIPGHAHGIRNSPGGLAVVGERGPELVNLPRGSSVFSNSESRSMLGGREGPLIGEVHVHDNADIEVLAQRVSRVLAFGA